MHLVINAALPIAVALLIHFIHKQRNWLALYFGLSGVGYLLQVFLFPGNYEVYAARRFIIYLVSTGAFAEIVRNELKATPKWAYGVWLSIVIPALFFPPYGFWYFVPRLPLFLWRIAYLPLALRKKHAVLIGFGIMDLYYLTTDALKLFQAPENILMIQRVLDPWVTVLFFVIVAGDALYLLIQNTYFVAQKKDFATDTGNVFSFPGTETDSYNSPRRAEIEQVVSEQVSELETVFAALAKTAEIHRKSFLNQEDLEIILGLKPMEIEPFLELYNIKKIPISEDKWIVSKREVFIAMDLEPE